MTFKKIIFCLIVGFSLSTNAEAPTTENELSQENDASLTFQNESALPKFHQEVLTAIVEDFSKINCKNLFTPLSKDFDDIQTALLVVEQIDGYIKNGHLETLLNEIINAHPVQEEEVSELDLEIAKDIAIQGVIQHFFPFYHSLLKSMKVEICPAESEENLKKIILTTTQEPVFTIELVPQYSFDFNTITIDDGKNSAQSTSILNNESKEQQDKHHLYIEVIYDLTNINRKTFYTILSDNFNDQEATQRASIQIDSYIDSNLTKFLNSTADESECTDPQAVQEFIESGFSFCESLLKKEVQIGLIRTGGRYAIENKALIFTLSEKEDLLMLSVSPQYFFDIQVI